MGNKEGKNKQTTYIELTQTELDNLKLKTNFNEREIRDWHAGFCDDCPTGKLRYDQFLEIFREFYVQDNRATIFCNYVFEMLDRDGDKMITFDEFLLGISSTHQGNLNKRLGLVFDMYDVSGNGQIDEKELITMISAMYNLVGETARDSKKTARNIINKFDRTNDKKLNKFEFIKACKEDHRLIRMLGPNAEEYSKPTAELSSSENENDHKNNNKNDDESV